MARRRGAADSEASGSCGGGPGLEGDVMVLLALELLAAYVGRASVAGRRVGCQLLCG